MTLLKARRVRSSILCADSASSVFRPMGKTIRMKNTPPNATQAVATCSQRKKMISGGYIRAREMEGESYSETGRTSNVRLETGVNVQRPTFNVQRRSHREIVGACLFLI